MPGLRQKLNDYIKGENGAFVSHDTVKQLCKQWGYRESNAERRLRPSESPNVERIMKNGAIVGYRWRVYTEPHLTAEAFFRDFPPKPKQQVKTLW